MDFVDVEENISKGFERGLMYISRILFVSINGATPIVFDTKEVIVPQ